MQSAAITRDSADYEDCLKQLRPGESVRLCLIRESYDPVLGSTCSIGLEIVGRPTKGVAKHVEEVDYDPICGTAAEL